MQAFSRYSGLAGVEPSCYASHATSMNHQEALYHGKPESIVGARIFYISGIPRRIHPREKPFCIRALRKLRDEGASSREPPDACGLSSNRMPTRPFYNMAKVRFSLCILLQRHNGIVRTRREGVGKNPEFEMQDSLACLRRNRRVALCKSASEQGDRDGSKLCAEICS